MLRSPWRIVMLRSPWRIWSSWQIVMLRSPWRIRSSWRIVMLRSPWRIVMLRSPWRIWSSWRIVMLRSPWRLWSSWRIVMLRSPWRIVMLRSPWRIWSSWSYSHENGPLRSRTSVSISHHAKMWGVNHAIFGIIRNAMSYSITRWNMTIFWRANFMLYHFESKICFFINIYFHQTQSAGANRYQWTLLPLKNIGPYSICIASIIKAKEAFFNKTNEIISYKMHAVAMDTTTKPF